MKSTEGSARIRPASRRSSSSVHGAGRERESEPRERVREWAQVGEEDVLAFNAAYGVAGEGSMAGTWRRPTILGHGAGKTEPSRTVHRSQADCPRDRALQSYSSAWLGCIAGMERHNVASLVFPLEGQEQETTEKTRAHGHDRTRGDCRPTAATRDTRANRHAPWKNFSTAFLRANGIHELQVCRFRFPIHHLKKKIARHSCLSDG